MQQRLFVSTREALEVIEQCVSLPGETSHIVRHYLRQQCISRSCETLNQLQLLIRISGRANSVLELLLLRLDEQGLDISSPWRISGGDLIVSVLWPKLYAAWLTKEQWAGCREGRRRSSETMGAGSALISSMCQLRKGRTRYSLDITITGHPDPMAGLHLDELANSLRHCRLSPVEYAALTSWLSLLETQKLERSAAASGPSEVMEDWSVFSDILPQRCHSSARNATMLTDLPRLECETSVGIKWHERLRCPPCIRGLISGIQPYEQLVLRCIPHDGLRLPGGSHLCHH